MLGYVIQHGLCVTYSHLEIVYAVSEDGSRLVELSSCCDDYKFCNIPTLIAELLLRKQRCVIYLDLAVG